MPIVPTWGTKLWEETATARTIGMPNNEGMRDQPSTELAVELDKKRAKTERF